MISAGAQRLGNDLRIGKRKTDAPDRVKVCTQGRRCASKS